MLQDLVHHAHDEVKTFRRDEARDHGDHRRATADWQTEVLLQEDLVIRLAVERRDIVALVEVLVRARIVDVVVDAVDDAEQRVLTAAQQAVEMLAEVLVLDLLGIRLADRRDVVSVNQTALHEVDGIVELEVAVVEVLPVEAKHIAHDILREDALVLEVVDGVERADLLVALIALMLDLQQHIDEARMPIIRVDDIWPEVHGRQQVEHGAAEEREALCIIAVAVEAFATEVLLVVDEVVGDAVVLDLVEADVFRTPGNRDLTVVDVLHRIAELLRDLAEFRHDDADIDALCLECLRQRARHIGKTARLGKRNSLRSNI